ncbi:SMP-30/gluconolactonase/LRE family protein [Bythopirellula goksoeyrii]|uniref:SMP-30/Gluconolaconase/LRE-like region n=1 Tax=Bythopirellula goksoeyrii TaxID=1400387 RepID=A0A5B9QFS3_9BACT|nr:SMP-30/gluconolactonase/LRE family protein [Bythopirellula goksoeyrii]QEG36412.1 SMP-30/Gluconolaconase/LRE-like region [Bythopirellula goksoeyrii]
MAEIPVTSFKIHADGLDHPEGVSRGPNGLVYAGGEAGQIYRIQPGGTVEMIANTGGFILGLCLDAECNVYACDIKNKAVMRIDPEGTVEVYSNGSDARKMITPNYPVFDTAGNLYVADSGSWHESDGCIYCIRPGGVTEIASSDFAEFPNGLAISPDSKELYVALSNVPSVAKADFLPDGKLGAPEMVVEMPRIIPDGLAFDAECNLYIACYTPDIIYRFSREGKLTVFAEDWESTTLSSPTNVTYIGEQLQTMVVASLSRWHLAQLDVEIPGCPLNYPIINKSGEFV